MTPLRVATPDERGSYVNPLGTSRPEGLAGDDAAASKRAKALKELLASELRRLAREELGEWTADERDVRRLAMGTLTKRCRALCEKGSKQHQRRLPLAQWCVALRGLAVAAGLPAPRDRDLAALWAASDRGDFAKFGREAFSTDDGSSKPSPATEPSPLSTTTPRGDWIREPEPAAISMGAPSLEAVPAAAREILDLGRRAELSDVAGMRPASKVDAPTELTTSQLRRYEGSAALWRGPVPRR